MRGAQRPSAAIEQTLRAEIAQRSTGGTELSARVPQILLAFLLDGQGKENLALSQWRAMVAQSKASAASIPSANAPAFSKTGI